MIFAGLSRLDDVKGERRRQRSADCTQLALRGHRMGHAWSDNSAVGAGLRCSHPGT
jgi:hypothetical protein